MNSRRNEPPNCFSGIIGRIFCAGSAPTYPSDHITLKKPEPKTQTKIQIQPTTNPGIVARLMGLESLPPNTNTNTNWVPKQRTLESFLRSKSVNSLNCVSDFDLPLPQHRRVRTSVSFREVPSDLFVFCFEKPLPKVENEKKSDVGFEGMKVKEVKERPRRRRRRRSVRETEKPNKAYGGSKVKVCDRLDCGNNKMMKKTQLSAKKVVPKCRLENSSSVSVSDIYDLPIHLQAAPSENSGEMKLVPKAKNLSKISNWEWDDPCPIAIAIADENQYIKSKNNRGKGKGKGSLKIRESELCVELLSRNICRWTEEDLNKSNWMAIDIQDFEDIYTEFGQHVLESLLNQMVEELVVVG